MSTATLEIITPADEPVIITRRWVKAPVELVWEVTTNAEHMKQWLGPRELEMVLCETDPRVGGAYRFVQLAPDGSEHHFRGEYREVDAPHRLTYTFIYEAWPDHESVETVELTAKDGGTLITSTMVHVSLFARDQMVESGMEGGVREGYERMDELLAELLS